MPSPNDHVSENSEADSGPREPMVDRQLELDLLRQHIALVAERGNGHAVLIVGESLSAIVPLLPGDIIFTGTPAGVGFARQPPRYLRPGQVVESWIEGIGTIRNLCR